MSRRSLLLALAAPALVGVYASCGDPLPNDNSADGSGEGGAEGSTAEGGAPDAGAPEAAPLATGLYAPLYVKEDGVNVFVSSVDGGVYKIRKDESILAQSLGNGPAWGLTTADNYVFFCQTGSAAAVQRVDKDTGAQILLAKSTADCLELARSDDGFIYYTTGHFGGVYRVPKEGDGGGLLYGATADEAPEGIAVDDSSVYFADLSGTQVHAIDHDGGNHRIIGRGIEPRKVALDDDHVYWVDYDTNTVKRVPKAGSDPDGGAVIGSGPGNTGKGGLAVDDRYVYWIVSQATEGTLNRAPKDGGGPSSVLVNHLDDPVDVAVDSDFIYFTQETPGRVMRLEKR